MSPISGANTNAERCGTDAGRWLGVGWRAYAALLAFGVSVVLAAAQGLGFSSSVTTGLVERYVRNFGQGARDRIGGWQQFIRSIVLKQGTGSDLELLGPVNAYFNRLPFLADQRHWGVQDYWATPAEMVASNGGDCEDYSIAKYFALKELGVQIQRLRITYVKAATLDQAHMVLAYYAEPNAVPLILDNLTNEVKPASERPDLIPVFSFNDEDLLFARQGQAGISAGSASQIRLWRGLLDKLEQELKY
jgi:predicted transglutaminase-like cysteine proteinase